MLRRSELADFLARRKVACAILGTFALALASGGAVTAAEALATDKKAEKNPAVVLSPAMETKLAEAMKKAEEAKRKFWMTRMKKEIERVSKATGLGADGAKALEAVAEQSTDTCLGGWTASLSESWRSFFSQQTEDSPEIEQAVSQLDQSAQMDWFGDFVRPFEHPKWEEGLRQTLSAEQFAAWEKLEKDRKTAVRKEAADALKAMVDQTVDQHRRGLLAKSAAIKASLSLPKERADKLDALAETAATTVAEGMRTRGEKMLFAADDEQRKQLLKTRQFYVGLDEKDLEKKDAVWKEGVVGLLTAEESKQLEDTQKSFMAQRAIVMGQILLAQLDEKVAFTAEQRQRLQAIAERLVKEQPALFPDGNQENFYRIEPQNLLGAGAKATENELTAILDANQWKHWQEACLAKNFGVGRVVVTPKKTPASAGPNPPAPAPEPEEVENGFSDFLQERSATERTRLLAVNLLKAEDAARVAGLIPDAVARLETAARGAAEEALTAWKSTTENSVRAQVRDATPENVRQRLAGMESYIYSRNNTAGSPGPAVWDKTLKTELTEANRGAWRKELDARNAYRDMAIAALIMSEFHRRIPLTDTQFATLEPLVTGALRDYAPDIAMMFSSNYSYSWYLQSYSMFIPIAAVPEKDLKAILTKEQWERWTGGEEIAMTNNYWENVQRNHTQRVKEKK